MGLSELCAHYNLLKHEVNLETHPLYCLIHETNLADIEVSIKILLSADVLCLIGYLAKNLRKNVKPSQ